MPQYEVYLDVDVSYPFLVNEQGNKIMVSAYICQDVDNHFVAESASKNFFVIDGVNGIMTMYNHGLQDDMTKISYRGEVTVDVDDDEDHYAGATRAALCLILPDQEDGLTFGVHINKVTVAPILEKVFNVKN